MGRLGIQGCEGFAMRHSGCRRGEWWDVGVRTRLALSGLRGRKKGRWGRAEKKTLRKRVNRAAFDENANSRGDWVREGEKVRNLENLADAFVTADHVGVTRGSETHPPSSGWRASLGRSVRVPPIFA